MSRSMIKGSAVADVVIAAAMVVFVILPVFSSVAEKYILQDKAQIIKDAVDMTNISVYNALIAENLGKVSVDFDHGEAEYIFRTLLASDLKLDPGLDPLPQSLAEDKVRIESLEIYIDDFPVTCPDGVLISRPSVHSAIIVPVRPSLYRQVVLSLLGKDFIDLKVHVDSEIPLNN